VNKDIMSAEGASEVVTDPAVVDGEKKEETAPNDSNLDKPSIPTAAVEGEVVAPVEKAGDSSIEHSKRVYVGNLAWEVTSWDLGEHMKASGLDVVSANVLTSPDGRSKGCGIVEFASPEVATEAVQKVNDSELKGRQIFVREDRGERRSTGTRGGFERGGYERGGGGRGRGRSGTFAGRTKSSHFSSSETAKDRRVYVGNLSWEVAWQDLKDHMIEAGEVVRAEVIKEPSGRSKGCGIVEFATDEGAKNAISMLTDTELKGRRIFVREDREITKHAGRGGDFGGRGGEYGGRGGGRGRGEYRNYDSNR
jgi:RNA recognition motif-containing protein